ncbi:MAG TPA: hypothetical protein VK203_11225 [Nostocaceae cyanobacterium]|nr:hypothetical protein [Nostocaceae cyanobacterium]
MTSRFLLPFILATFVYSGYVVAEVRQPKPTASPSKTRVTPKKPTTNQKKPVIPDKKPTVPKIVQPKWKVFTPPDKSFYVLMPGIPAKKTQIQKTHMGEIQLRIFTAVPIQQEVAYIVTYNEFPYDYAKLTSPQEIFNQAQEGALKTTQSTLINQRNIRSSNGQPGREIEYINPGKNITKTRMYFAEGRLYQVTAVVSQKQQKTLDKTINGYLNSFQVVVRR